MLAPVAETLKMLPGVGAVGVPIVQFSELFDSVVARATALVSASALLSAASEVNLVRIEPTAVVHSTPFALLA